MTLFRIEKRGSKWVVLPESGDKVLGEHDTKADAEKQLAAIEAHKNMGFAPSGPGGLHEADAGDLKRPRMSRIFSVNAFRFALSVGAGKWDRLTSYGTKIKDGVESVFDETNLGQMIQNFANRKNDIAMCYDHQSAYVAENGQPAPALAWYNALALVVDGKIANFATHDLSVGPPDATGLENGVYGYRAELTPLGEKLLPGYRYVSPMFTDEGADEQGNPIGYDLIDVAATNTPFQDGVGLTFHRMGDEPSKKGKFAQERIKMAEDMFKKLGLSDGASADEMKGAMAKYMADAEDKAKAFADLEEKMKKFEADKAAEAEKMDKADGDGEKMSKDADGDDDGDKEAAEKMAKDLGLEKGAKMAKMYAAFAAKMVPMSKLAETENRLKVLEDERAAEKQAAAEKQYAELADKGIAHGYAKEKRDDLIKFARADFAAAQSFVESLPGAKLFTRVTTGGNPTGNGRTDSTGAPMATIQGREIPVRGSQLSSKAKAYAKEHKCDLATAQREVLKADPSLLADYVG